MANETPTLRDQDLWSGTFLRLERGTGRKDKGQTRAYLYLGDSADAEVDIDLPDAVFAALAAALDPRTTEVLFEQRDAAIERAKAAEEMRDAFNENGTRLFLDCANLMAERDTAIAQRDRWIETAAKEQAVHLANLARLVEADAERVRLAKEVNRLEALTAQVDITRLGTAERQLRCNACGHVKAEPRERS